MRRFLIGVSLFGVLLLQGCAEESEYDYKGYDSDLKALADDLDGYSLNGGRYQLHIEDDKIQIMGRLASGLDEKNELDEFLKTQGIEPPDAVFIFEEYEDVKIKTKGNQYTVSIDDFPIHFLKFNEHILVDKDGTEYIRQKMPE